MGGTRSSHLPLDRKSVLNIISFRSSMPARRDVGNSGVGESCCSWDRVVCLRISLSHSLFLLRFCIHFHRLTVFIITAHFAFWHFSHQFFVASFYTFGPLPLADGDGEGEGDGSARRWTTALSTVIRVCSLQCASRMTTTDERSCVASAAASALGKQLTTCRRRRCCCRSRCFALSAAGGGWRWAHTNTLTQRDTYTGWHNHDRWEPNP